MLIECKYYDVAAKENEELLEKIAEESENLSEEELQLENDRRDFQLAEIIRSFKEKEKMKEIVPDPEKIALFIRLQRASMELAKLLELNIVTMKKMMIPMGILNYLMEFPGFFQILRRCVKRQWQCYMRMQIRFVLR